MGHSVLIHFDFDIRYVLLHSQLLYSNRNKGKTDIAMMNISNE